MDFKNCSTCKKCNLIGIDWDKEDFPTLCPTKQKEISDAELEALWKDLSNEAFDEDEDGRLFLANDFACWEKGTWNEDIWKWFDAMHSKGVIYLLYHLAI